jgi:ribosomal protein S10
MHHKLQPPPRKQLRYASRGRRSFFSEQMRAHKATITFLSHSSPLLDYYVSFARQAAQAMHIKPTRTIYPIRTTPDTPFLDPKFPSTIKEALDIESASENTKFSGISRVDTRGLSYEYTRYTVNKSPFAHGRHQDQFEMRTYKRQLGLFDADTEVVKRWMHYIATNMPAGIGFEWEVVDYERLDMKSEQSRIA